MNKEKKEKVVIATLCIFAILCVIVIGMWAYPKYNIYASRAEGQAMLAHAQSSKEVAVAEAKAKMESAELLAQAEIFRAKGVAQANQIIGQSLKDNEAYLRYLWITDVAGSNVDKTVVYVPTEGNLPILEASRMGGSGKGIK
jgi:regulator of protease activity HflC (stomatin/prohibitin superfamily)